jgi:cyanophycin synthetase
VLETARGGILREGLAFDRCSVGVVTNISSDHLGMSGIDTLEDLARVKQVVIESVAKDGSAVLNADDRLVSEMAASTEADVIYFSLNPNNPIVQAHLEEGGSCVFIEDGSIVLATGQERDELVELDRIAFTMNGKIRFQVQNALAAAAAAWSTGVNPAMIVRALTTFKTEASMTPGRFNVTEINGVQIILDYAHNEAAIKALGDAVNALDKRQTTMVIGLPGDRRDTDLVATFEATLPFVDSYILHDLEDIREREPLEIPRLLASRIPAGIPHQFADSQESGVRQAWQSARKGDRIVVIVDIADKTIEILQRLAESDAVCSFPLVDESRNGR